MSSVTSTFKGSGVSRLAAQIRRAEACSTSHPSRKNYAFLTHKLAEAPLTRINTQLTTAMESFSPFNKIKGCIEDETTFRSLFKPGCAPPPSTYSARQFMEARPWSVSRGLLFHVEDLRRMRLGDTADRAIFVCHWFPVEKDQQVFRLITALKPLNKLQERPPFMGLPPIHAFMEALLRCSWVVQYDAQSYFFQFALAPMISLYFAALATGNRGLATLVVLYVLAMGWSHAPCIAQRFANCVCVETKFRMGDADEHEAIAWVDNFGLGSIDFESTCKVRDTFLSICKYLNVTLKKTDDTPTQRFIALGMEFDLKEKSIRLSEKFLTQMREAIALRKRTPTARTLFVSLGGIFWSAFTTTRKALCFYPAVVAYIRELSQKLQNISVAWDEPLTLPQPVQNELQRLESDILVNSPIYYHELVCPSEKLATLWADASEHAAGFVLEQDGYDVAWGSSPFPAHIASLSIFFKEMWAAAESIWISSLILHDWRLGSPKDSIPGLIYAGDNSAVIYCIKKGHARSTVGNSILQRIIRASAHQVFHQAWVSTIIQRADPLTRGHEFPKAESIRVSALSPQFTIAKKC